MQSGFLKGKKTYITAILSILGVLGAYATGEATLMEAINLVVPAVLAMTVRKGVADK